MIITLSDDGYIEKPSRDRYHRMSFSNYELTLQEVFYAVIGGKTLSCTFQEPFTEDFTLVKVSKREMFKHIQYVMVDIDDTPEDTLEEVIEAMPYEPNIAYTTFSHQLEDYGNRYRLLYFFDEPIKNPYLYRELYDKLTDGTKCKKDPSAKSPYQFSHGTNLRNISGDALAERTHYYEDIYRISDFGCKERNVRKVDKTKRVYSEVRDNANEFFKDMAHMRFSDLYYKYRDVYQIVTESDLLDSGDERFMYYPDDYHSVKGRWITENKVRKVRVWRDGERRRNKLFAIARKIVMIKPDISMEGLMFNLLFQRNHFFNNDDHVLSFDCLLSIAQDALKAKGIPMINDRHPARRINMSYCQEHGKKWQSVMWDIRNEARDNALCELYDPGLTLKENVERMESLGFKIGLSTLKRWVSEHREEDLKPQGSVSIVSLTGVSNTTHTEPFSENKATQSHLEATRQHRLDEEMIIPLLDLSQSARWNHANLKEQGYNVGRNKVMEIYNKLKRTTA